MSVKNKVKRCNKEIKRLESKASSLEIKLDQINNNFKRISEDYQEDLIKLRLYENIIKFVITNQIGNLRGGMMIDCSGIDKMKGLELNIEIKLELNSYILRVDYR